MWGWGESGVRGEGRRGEQGRVLKRGETHAEHVFREPDGLDVAC